MPKAKPAAPKPAALRSDPPHLAEQLVPEVAPATREESGAKFSIDGKSVSLISTLVSMKGTFTASNKEKKKTDFLFTEFGGKVEDNVFDVIMSNKTQNVCANLKFKLAEGSVIRSGKVWCGEIERFVSYCTKIAMKGKITVTFTRTHIIFTDEDDVSSEMRNVDPSTLDYVKQAREMINLLERGDQMKYKGQSLGTTIKLEFSDLKPIISDASVIENYNYPITVKQKDGEFVVFFEIVDEKKMNKVYRPIKNVEVDGQECHSEYVVGIDSMVTNLSGKALFHLGDWSPLVVETANTQYDYLMILAPMKKSDESSTTDYDFEDESDGSDDEDEGEDDDTASADEEIIEASTSDDEEEGNDDFL